MRRGVSLKLDKIQPLRRGVRGEEEEDGTYVCSSDMLSVLVFADSSLCFADARKRA